MTLSCYLYESDKESMTEKPTFFPFPAGYETGAGSYKHVYFNATGNTLVMWSITVVALVALYEAVRMTFVSLYTGRARPRMCVLFLSVLYPHYYAW